MPPFEHELVGEGFRIIAHPPGEMEGHFDTDVHLLRVNLNTIEYEWATDGSELQTHVAPTDSVRWMPVGSHFRLKAQTKNWCLYLEIDPERIDALGEQNGTPLVLPMKVVDYRFDLRAATLARLAIEELRSADPDATYLTGITLSLLSVVARAADGTIEDGQQTDERIDRAIAHIEEHIGTYLDVETLASIANVSTAHFARAFKNQSGEPVWTFVQRRRCEKARELLLNTSASMQEIGDLCGFANPSHFARVFRRVMGRSPSSIRSPQ